jgi:class 3 adenylate cyclase/tetratricopeptide (TPR) repeat protein
VGATGLVAILFTDLVGSTETVTRLGGERAEELRQAHFALLREAIRNHGGTEVKNLGDGLMVAFRAASDAVAGAVAMQQALARHNRRGGETLAMRVGVAVGEATCEEADYFGTPVIEAARLCARAEGGEVLVTEMVQALAGTRGGAEFVSLGPVQLKGLATAVLVHRVRWEALADDAPPLPPRLTVDPSVTFIGRAAEREVLDGAWKRAEQGALQVVLLAGEPGIGKTRLATEIALQAHGRGGLALLGRCDEDLALPYQPFVEALRYLVTACPQDALAEGLIDRGGELTRLLPELSRRVTGLAAPQSADPDTERYLLFSAVSGLLSAISRWRPVLLLLDDLQWATKATLLLLKHLVRSSEPMALLIVGTYRDSDIGRDHPLTNLLADLRRDSAVERLGLRGLSDDEAVVMMETLAGHDLEGPELALAHAVHAEADGSPLFMRELLRHFFELGDLHRDGDRWTFRGRISEIPDSVREVIGQRLSRLPEPVDRLLSLAAVIGPEFDVAVLCPLAGLDRSMVLDALAAARQAALVREVQDAPGRFTFAHALIRHTLYEELGPARQVEAHRRVAETLESLAGDGEAYVSELARHWVAAIPQSRVRAEDVGRAARYAEQAGLRAMASLAYEEAAQHFAGALRAANHADDRAQVCELLILLGEAQCCGGDPAHRETLLDAGHRALERGDPDRAARAALANQPGLFSRMGAVDAERVAALEAALDAVGSAATPARARLLASLATELQFSGADRRLELAQEAVEVARLAYDPATVAHALAALCLAAWGSAAQVDQGPLAGELSELAGHLGDRTLDFHASVAVFYSAMARGEVDRADTALALCTRIADELGQPALRWRVAHLQMQRAMADGRFHDVERWAEETLQLGEATGHPDSLLFAHGPLAITWMLQGRPEEALALVTPVVEQAPRAVYRGVQAWALAEAGRRDDALTIVERLRAPQAFAGVPHDHHRPFTLCLSARTCFALGDAAMAEELYDLLTPFHAMTVNGQTIWFGPATHELGLLATMLGRYDEAEAHFADAVERQDRMGAQGTVVHTRLAWADLLLRRNGPEDRRRARTLLDEAKVGAKAVNIPRMEGRIDSMLARVG